MKAVTSTAAAVAPVGNRPGARVPSDNLKATAPAKVKLKPRATVRVHCLAVAVLTMLAVVRRAGGSSMHAACMRRACGVHAACMRRACGCRDAWMLLRRCVPVRARARACVPLLQMRHVHSPPATTPMRVQGTLVDWRGLVADHWPTALGADLDHLADWVGTLFVGAPGEPGEQGLGRLAWWCSHHPLDHMEDLFHSGMLRLKRQLGQGAAAVAGAAGAAPGLAGQGLGQQQQQPGPAAAAAAAGMAGQVLGQAGGQVQEQLQQQQPGPADGPHIDFHGMARDAVAAQYGTVPELT